MSLSSAPDDPTPNAWAAALAWRRAQTGPVVFTNGCFDLLHVGHVDLLTQARALGAALIVGVNGDASVRQLKGPARPIQPAVARAHVLAALRAVDQVVIFEEETPAALLRVLRPDVLVKGADYSEDTIVGAADVRAWGGTVRVIPLTAGHSTSATLRRIVGG